MAGFNAGQIQKALKMTGNTTKSAGIMAKYNTTQSMMGNPSVFTRGGMRNLDTMSLARQISGQRFGSMHKYDHLLASVLNYNNNGNDSNLGLMLAMGLANGLLNRNNAATAQQRPTGSNLGSSVQSNSNNDADVQRALSSNDKELINKTLKETEKTIEEAQTKVGELNKKEDAKQTEITNLKNDYDAKQTATKTAKTATETATKNKDDIKGKLDTAKSKLNGLTGEEKTKQEGEINRLKGEYDTAVKEENGAKEAEKTAISNEEKAKAAVKNAEDELKEITQELSKANANLSTNQGNVVKLQDRLDNLQTKKG